MQTHRTCSACGETKPRADFYPDRRRGPDALNHRCKPCERAVALARHHRNHEVNNARSKEWAEANRAHLNDRGKRLYWQNPESARLMSRAHQAVLKAIKAGNLTRPNACAQCGGGGRIEAAHSDYNAPLDVRWLCRSCHVRWDRALPKAPHR